MKPERIKPELEKLLEKLKTYEKSRFETRAFVYLDIISWLESKIKDVPVQDVIREKYLNGNRRGGRGLVIFYASSISSSSLFRKSISGENIMVVRK